MTETSAITIPDASAITVDTSCIDVSEVESQEDKDFLMDIGGDILRIVAKAALEVGEKICKVQERFRDKGEVGLGAWYESLRINSAQASRWANKYRTYCAYVELFGDDGARESFNLLSDTAAARIWTLPEGTRNAFLADIACGESPSTDLVEEVSKRPEVKLSKAEELLAQAKARKAAADERWEAVKADPNIPFTDRQYDNAHAATQRASNILKKAEERIAKLQAEVEAEKLKAKQQAEETARVETELQKFKFDTAAARAERVARVGSSLTLSIPQTLADVQKFFAEVDEYDEAVRKHIRDQAKLLADYIGDQL